jgi:hypothetical protein
MAAPSPDGQWPSFGTWPNCVSGFVEPLLKWIPQFQPILRFAFGAVVVLPVTDRASGYRQLESSLGELKVRIPEDVTDFLLQFNRSIAAPNGPPGMTINRIFRCGVAVLAPLRVRIATTPSGPPLTTFDPNAEHSKLTALRIEVDFNTAPEWSQAITIDQAETLTRDLPQLAINGIEELIK